MMEEETNGIQTCLVNQRKQKGKKKQGDRTQFKDYCIVKEVGVIKRPFQ